MMPKPKKKLKMEDIKKNSDIEVLSTIERIKLHEREYLMVTTAIFMVIICLVLFVLFGGFNKESALNIFRVGDLNVKYDTDIMGLSYVITLNEDSIVNNEEEGINSQAHKFSISNASNGVHKYNVYIENDLSMIDIDGCSYLLANDDAIYFSVNNSSVRKLSEVKKDNGYLIVKGEVTGENTINYDLKIWILKDDLKDSRKNHFHGSIKVEEIEEE